MLSWLETCLGAILVMLLLVDGASRGGKQLPQDDWEITCYTCENKTDNFHCNRFAVDRPCPKGTDYCHTLHILDDQGNSLMVTKNCATRAQCRTSDVGCVDLDKPGHMRCVSCCDVQYCNEFIPMNETTAILLTTRIFNSATSEIVPTFSTWLRLIALFCVCTFL